MNLLEIRRLRAHLKTPSGMARAVDGVDMVIQEGEAVGKTRKRVLPGELQAPCPLLEH